MNVLLLDDDVLDLEGMKLLIDWEQAGVYKVFCARSVSEARAVLQEESIDIALCDIEMNGESGLDFAQWMADEKMDILVIFVTSHAKFDYASKALKLRARDYLLKPVSGEALEESVRNAIQYRQYFRNPGSSTNESKKPPMTEKEVVVQAKAYIRENLGKAFTRSDIAKTVYLHPDYLSHIFHEETGMTLSEYILQERIYLARCLLEEERYSITEIGEIAGFSNSSYFGKMFRRCTGFSPKEYRTGKRKDGQL